MKIRITAFGIILLTIVINGSMWLIINKIGEKKEREIKEKTISKEKKAPKEPLFKAQGML